MMKKIKPYYVKFGDLYGMDKFNLLNAYYHLKKDIQISDDGEEWNDIKNPEFDICSYYRIKPEVKYIPYKKEHLAELIGCIIYNKYLGITTQIISVNSMLGFIIIDGVQVFTEDLVKNWKFQLSNLPVGYVSYEG